MNLKAHYQRGGLGDVKVKKFLNNVMQAELGPIRERRKMWEQRTEDVFDILKAGTEVAQRKKLPQRFNDVRSSMRINYFEDQDFLNSVIENSERNHRLVYRINPEIVFRVDFFRKLCYYCVHMGNRCSAVSGKEP